MRVLKIAVVSFVFVSAIGCTSMGGRYRSVADGNVPVVPCESGAKVVEGGLDAAYDVQGYVEKNYGVLGYMKFWGTRADNRYLLGMARRHKASICLYYPKFDGDVHRVLPDVPELAEDDEAVPEFLQGEPMQLAVLLSPLKHPDRLGLRFSDPTSADQRRLGTHKYAKVSEVVRGKPAWHEDVEVGDFLMSVNGITVYDARDAVGKIDAAEGNASFVFWHKGKSIQKTINLGKIPKETHRGVYRQIRRSPFRTDQ